MDGLYDHSRQHAILDLLGRIRPWVMRRNSKVRVGGVYDGGYVLPMAALNCDSLVSIGVGPDVSFDLVLAQRGTKVIQFDHTVEKPPVEHPGFTFYREGWGAETEGNLVSFPVIMERLAALNPTRSIFKFDIEGAEYQVFPGLSKGDLAPFDVICCELHELHRIVEPEFLQRFIHVLDVLTENHSVVHLHANNAGGMGIVEGVPVPRLVELTLLRKDLDSFPFVSRDPIPGPLDAPNIPQWPELVLTPF